MINNITPIKRKKFIRLLIMSMIVLSLILINSNIALAQSAPSKPDVNLYIFDYANLIDDSDEQEMRKIAKVLDDKTKAQIVVVTVNDLSQMELEDYALKLFRSWGIGDKQKNNGLLILVNKESLIKAQREMCIRDRFRCISLGFIASTSAATGYKPC